MSRARTKVLATLGPATDVPGTLAAMIAAGLDGVRINCAHGSPEDWEHRVAEARGAAAAAGRRVAVLLDLAGPKVRLGSEVLARSVTPGDLVEFVGGIPDGAAVLVEWPDLAAAAVPGESELIIGDGTPRFRVTGLPDGACTGGRVSAECTEPGEIAPRRGAALTHARTDHPALTLADRAALDVGARIEADLVALSFVRGAGDMQDLRREMRRRGLEARTVAKIEKAEAHARLDEIIETSDGIMVARGDLGVEVGVDRVPLLQKDITRRALLAGRLVITATQMLESMVSAAQPTRAEATDVANAVLDGTAVLMLSGETAIGANPVAAVRWMHRIAVQTEVSEPLGVSFTAPARGHEAVMQAAALLATRLDAAALLVPTHGGASARALSALRPRRPIIALAHEPRVADQLALEWGVVPMVMPEVDDVEELIAECMHRARGYGLRDGAMVVIAMGPTGGPAEGGSMIVTRAIGAEPPAARPR